MERIHHFSAPLDRPTDFISHGKIIEHPWAMDAGIYRVGDECHLYCRQPFSETEDHRNSALCTSRDLYHWSPTVQAPGDVTRLGAHGLSYQEGHYPFRWRGSYWLLTDAFVFGPKGLGLRAHFRTEVRDLAAWHLAVPAQGGANGQHAHSR